ncbi:MAG TPA: hypothetical protein VEH04_09150 [Verrucomicrobiae bacterium]|nr:hypothetical protein [Verrucomicrobiae bacterium]
MNGKFVFAASLSLNAALVIALVSLQDVTSGADPTFVTAIDSPAVPPLQAVVIDSEANPSAIKQIPFRWSSLESQDYRQYVSNLRAIHCPEETLRDIIVADLDQLCASKPGHTPPNPAPWNGATRRRALERQHVLSRAAMAAEKRALVRELIGYPWDHSSRDVWHQDSYTSILLGFLAASKGPQLLSLLADATEQARAIKEASGGILIAEDREALRRLYHTLQREMSGMLSAADKLEFELRTQAGAYLPVEDIHWDGVTINGGELREFVRFSLEHRDMFAEEFLAEAPLAGDTIEAKRTAFTSRVRTMLGPVRFSDYERAQDQAFRELFAFTAARNMTRDVAVHIYNTCRAAESQASQVRNDATLSAEEQLAALAVLKSMTTKSVAARLGADYREYVSGAGQWMSILQQEEAN